MYEIPFCVLLEYFKSHMAKFRWVITECHGRSGIRAIEIDSDHSAVKLVVPGRLENHM
jgi:hypothetical protein